MATPRSSRDETLFSDMASLPTFDKMKVTVNEVREWRPDGQRGENAPQTSIVAAVAQSRELCKLKYLTGAASVVYGIPFYL